MRVKEKYLLFLFSSVTEAMEMEERALSAGRAGRLIPLPSKVKAGCGLAFSIGEGSLEEWMAFCEAEALSYEGTCEVWI